MTSCELKIAREALHVAQGHRCSGTQMRREDRLYQFQSLHSGTGNILLILFQINRHWYQKTVFPIRHVCFSLLAFTNLFRTGRMSLVSDSYSKQQCESQDCEIPLKYLKGLYKHPINQLQAEENTTPSQRPCHTRSAARNDFSDQEEVCHVGSP